MNDSALIRSLQSKVGELEAEVRKLTEALRLEKDRSKEWKRQAVRLAEEQERNHAVDHPAERELIPMEGTPAEREP